MRSLVVVRVGVEALSALRKREWLLGVNLSQGGGTGQSTGVVGLGFKLRIQASELYQEAGLLSTGLSGVLSLI